MTDENNVQYDVIAGKPLIPTKPDVVQATLDDGTPTVQIAARSTAELRSILKGFKKKYPQLDLDQLVDAAQLTRTYPTGALKAQFQIGPRAVFPAAFVMASVFSAACELQPHPDFINYVNNFDPSNPVMPNETFYWIPSTTWFECDAEVNHIAVLFGSAKRKQALFYIELFNFPGVAVLLPYAGDQNVCFSYSVDVLQGQEMTVKVDEQVLDSLDWSKTHVLGDEELFKLWEQRGLELVEIIHDIAKEQEITRIMDEVTPDPNKPVTSAELHGMLLQVVDLAARQMPSTVGKTKEQLEAAAHQTVTLLAEQLSIPIDSNEFNSLCERLVKALRQS